MGQNKNLFDEVPLGDWVSIASIVPANLNHLPDKRTDNK